MQAASLRAHRTRADHRASPGPLRRAVLCATSQLRRRDASSSRWRSRRRRVSRRHDRSPPRLCAAAHACLRDDRPQRTAHGPPPNGGAQQQWAPVMPTTPDQTPMPAGAMVGRPQGGSPPTLNEPLVGPASARGQPWNSEMYQGPPVTGGPQGPQMPPQGGGLGGRCGDCGQCDDRAGGANELWHRGRPVRYLLG